MRFGINMISATLKNLFSFFCWCWEVTWREHIKETKGIRKKNNEEESEREQKWAAGEGKCERIHIENKIKEKNVFVLFVCAFLIPFIHSSSIENLRKNI